MAESAEPNDAMDSESGLSGQVEIRITVDEATNDAGLTLAGVIKENAEIVEQDDYVEPAVVDHVREKYGVEVEA